MSTRQTTNNATALQEAPGNINIRPLHNGSHESHKENLHVDGSLTDRGRHSAM
jgi:hypothetical protein